MKFDNIYKRIEELFEEQVRSGKQTEEAGIQTCGQFINEPGLGQRGLHGVSAAIYVLSQNDQYDELTNGLCEYAENFETYAGVEKLQSDGNNTIKQAELLFALCFVKAGTRDVHELKNQISNKLNNSIIEGHGWDYFLNDQKEVQLLSTAYCIRALMEAGYSQNIANSIRYLRFELKRKSNNIDNPTRLSIYVFCLYVLVFFDNKFKEFEKDYKLILKRIKKSKYFSLNNSFEQNLEYHGNDEHHYVRIPWQLYYLAITSKLSKWSFLNRYAQKRLKELQDKLLNGGFKYDFSGEHLSSRTYSIIEESLIKIEQNVPNSLLIKTAKIFNFIKPYLLYLVYVIVIIFMIFSIYKAVTNDFNLGDLAPEFVGYFVILLLSVNRKRK
ncbi:hypothetical protein [uncultured Draconibacterium sp.]|uniref:hypothetical protein n=1 Tax=uncultured Draconibacterium sp. TaxID=1573823 RepID=UPI0029C998B8|nr:hypothetical protein [uncultured Draconibacterium sp.]